MKGKENTETRELWIKYHERGTHYLHKHRLALSERYYRKAIDAAPSDKIKQRLNNSLGNVSYGRKNYQEAIDLYKKSLQYIDNKSVTLANIALAFNHLMGRKNKERAKLYSQKALAAIGKERSFYKDKKLKNDLVAALKRI